MSAPKVKIITRIKVENWSDTEMVAAGFRKDKPRAVDTGATKFYLKASVIQ